MIDIPPLRIGILGNTRLARGIAFQVKATQGMDVLWTEGSRSKLEETPVDVLIEASGSTSEGAGLALAALNSQTHVILTNPAVDLAIGPLLHATAYENGLIVSSDAGTRHGSLATLIQEAHIMGFDIVQAGAVCEENDDRLQMELASLANSFGFLPPVGGTTGPKISKLQEALTSFDFESFGDTAGIDYLVNRDHQGSIYLIVKPKPGLPTEQASYLNDYHLGSGPHYLLHRPYHLGHLETPKTILASAAGQAILAPGNQTANVYPVALEDLSPGTSINEGLNSNQLRGTALPFHPDQIPLALLSEDCALKKNLSKGQAITFDHLDLPDTPLTHLWIRQLELLDH